jgi:serine/threonine protein kinase
MPPSGPMEKHGQIGDYVLLEKLGAGGMEHVAGTDLQQHIHNHGPLSLETAAGYVQQVVRALVYLHAQGMVHRDIKPANLILTPEGLVKLVDLGLARCELSGGNPNEIATQLTATGMAMGTVDYIAPEQVFDAKSVDGRADLYGLGCVLYFLVHGQPPWLDCPLTWTAMHLPVEGCVAGHRLGAISVQPHRLASTHPKTRYSGQVWIGGEMGCVVVYRPATGAR